MTRRMHSYLRSVTRYISLMLLSKSQSCCILAKHLVSARAVGTLRLSDTISAAAVSWLCPWGFRMASELRQAEILPGVGTKSEAGLNPSPPLPKYLALNSRSDPATSCSSLSLPVLLDTHGQFMGSKHCRACSFQIKKSTDKFDLCYMTLYLPRANVSHFQHICRTMGRKATIRTGGHTWLFSS